MSTVPRATRSCNPTTAMYAQLDGEAGILAKVNGELRFFRYDGTSTGYDPAIAQYVTLLGHCELDEAAFILNHIEGGAARLCTTRRKSITGEPCASPERTAL